MIKLLTFLLLTLFIIGTKSSLINDVYADCNQDVNQRLDRECVGFNFESKSKNCLVDKSCSLLAIFHVIPSSYSSSNYFDEQLNVTLIGNKLRSSINTDLSLIIDASFNRHYTLDEGSYYNCTYFSKEEKVKSSIKQPNQSMLSFGLGSVVDNLIVCNWVMNKKDSKWPSLQSTKKVNLFSTQIEVIFVLNNKITPILDVRIPIFKGRHLYKDCSHPNKYCMGPNRCDKMLYICDALLTVEQNMHVHDILNWSLYAFYEPKNGEEFEIRISSHWAGPAFSVNCDKTGFKQYSHFVNGSSALLLTSLISDEKVITDPQFEGLRCFWSTPKKFSIYSQDFDLTNTKYFVKLKNFLTFWEEETGLPSYRLEKNLYKDCKQPLHNRITYDCYGLNYFNLDENCMQTETCSMIVVFEVEVRKNGNRYVDEDVILRTYHVDFNDTKTSNMHITFDLGDNSGQNINYTCSYKNKDKKAEVNHANGEALIAGRLSIDYGVFSCSWELKKDKNTWPILKNGTLLNLILKKVSMIIGLNGVSKTFDHTQVSLPIFKLRYLYGDCAKSDSICFGRDNCVENMNCTNLINFVQRNQGSDVIDVNIYALDNSDRLKIVFSSDNRLGNDFGVECSERIIEDFFIFKNLTTQPSFLQSRSLISYKLFAKDVFGLFGCYWTQPKQFEIFSQKYDTRLNQYYTNVTFYKSDKEDVLILKQVSFPGYTQKLRATNSSFQLSIQLIYSKTNVLLILILLNYLI